MEGAPASEEWGALPGVQRTAGSGEHCQSARLLVAVGGRRETHVFLSQQGLVSWSPIMAVWRG